LDSLARGYTTACVAALGAWATANEVDPNDPKKGGVNPDIKLRAIGMILDRGWGRPMQKQTNEISGGIEILLRDIAAEKAKKK
jgi:hypothetical protein